jgi:hypothetical protein
MDRNSSQCERIATGYGKIRQGRVTETVGLEWLNLGASLRLILVGLRKGLERTCVFGESLGPS